MPRTSLKATSLTAVLLPLIAVFLLALAVRLPAALDYGRDWYAPGSFTLINFDEGGSCRAALNGFSYSRFVGYQTIALAGLLGDHPPPSAAGDARQAKAYCHGEAHLTVARVHSAVFGAATAVALVLLGWMLFPDRRGVALVSGALLALSGWHASESLMGTVDAPSTFFIYLFFLAALWASTSVPAANVSGDSGHDFDVGTGVGTRSQPEFEARSQSGSSSDFAPALGLLSNGWRWAVALLALIAAVWTKFWVFAFLAALYFLPLRLWQTLLQGLSVFRIVCLTVAYALLFAVASNTATPNFLVWSTPLLFYVLFPWGGMSAAGRIAALLLPWLAPLLMEVSVFSAYTSGGLTGSFGTDYGAIGEHKWLRNLLNVPFVLLVGLGLPGFLLLMLGVRKLVTMTGWEHRHLLLLPLPAFLLYMAFLAPVTYYRHYLPLLPMACLIAALGLSTLKPSIARPATALVLLWQGLLCLDLLHDYTADPRRQLPQWYADHRPQRVLASFYAAPPPAPVQSSRLFRISHVMRNGGRVPNSDTLILSESWYDTAFANELNGPLVHDPTKLIKTRPEAASFYRAALSESHPQLAKVAHFTAPTFMPELRFHKRVYGSFTQFVGDIVVFRVLP
ncbi:MAG: hypothetical protein AAGG55_01300 [Pseudomonadota bacterium]